MIALKRYGLMTADNGWNWFFQGARTRRWDGGDLGELSSIRRQRVRGGVDRRVWT